MTARTLPAVALQVPVVAGAVLASWLLIAAVQLSGVAGLLHHHALIEHGPPIWIGLPVFLVSWLVMIGAMMLPASIPAIGGARRAGVVLAQFLAPYAVVWAVFGLGVFLADTVVHRLVDTTPWLAERAWLIDASVVSFAGAYQFLPVKHRGLASCRHAGTAPSAPRSPEAGPLGPGMDHALACVASSGGLMVLMFAEGFSSPWLMAALTGVMVYEVTGHHGHRLALVVGALLLLTAGNVVIRALV